MARLDELRRTAWHEAGHALVGFLYFGNPGKVTIVPKGRALGAAHTERFFASESVYFEALPPWMQSQNASRLIQHSLAGRAAETVLNPKLKLRDYFDEDALTAVFYAHWHPCLDETEALNIEWRRVRRWLKRHKPDLARFAARLLQERTMT